LLPYEQNMRHLIILRVCATSRALLLLPAQKSRIAQHGKPQALPTRTQNYRNIVSKIEISSGRGLVVRRVAQHLIDHVGIDAFRIAFDIRRYSQPGMEALFPQGE
jgi:hypothetical protein